MKKRTQARSKRLVDREVDQSKVIFFPSQIDSTYELYSAFRSGATLTKRQSWKDVLSHTLQILLWFVVLTSFFLSQKALLHSPAHEQLHFSDSLTATTNAKTAERLQHARL